MLDIIFPSIASIAAVTLLGAAFGLFLSIAMIKLRVVPDPRIMGQESPTAMIANTARVHCQGGTAETAVRFLYSGLRQCTAANGVMGGFKVCRYGCLGFGDCGRACSFNAIHMGGNGLPIVDYDRCTGCGMCVMACPRNIIGLAPRQNDVHTLCNNEEKSAVMKLECSAGCIACRLCEKACRKALSEKYPDRDPSRIELAIEVDNSLARINYDRCIQCHQCVYVCPVPVINPIVRSMKFQESGDQKPRESAPNKVESPV